VEWVAKVIENNLVLTQAAVVERVAADACPLPDDVADLAFSDPPYFAAIAYADLSDVFYVWLRRGLRGRAKHLLDGELVPKSKELVVTNSSRGPEGQVKDNEFFTTGMARALERLRAITKPVGCACFVFADSTTDAWEAMLNAVIMSGWTVAASWPIDTEMQGRTRARSAASLQSSVFLFCRPRQTLAVAETSDKIGDWRGILSELPRRMHEWMPRLASEGVVGADAIFACLGPALELFSRYARVERASGQAVTLKEYLEHVWAAVSKEALSMIFRDAEAAGLEADARLTAMWLWTLGGAAPVSNGNGKPAASEEAEDDEEASEEATPKPAMATGYTLEFDAARKIAQGLGAHLERSESVVEVKGDKARLLSVAERTQHLFGKGVEAESGKRSKKKPQQKSLFEHLGDAEATEGGRLELKGPTPGTTALDRLHQAMILFAAQRGEALKRFLVDDGVGKDARFWKLAQSLSALYPASTDEKRWVDGVLARKKGLGL
jgi:hypothetical protein